MAEKKLDLTIEVLEVPFEQVPVVIACCCCCCCCNEDVDQSVKVN
jgi:hypothetical protein